MKKLLFTIYLFTSPFIFAQTQIDSLEFSLQASGKLPETFTQQGQRTMYKDFKNSTSFNSYETVLKRRHDARSNFATYQLLRSGSLVYGDTLTNYLKDLMTLILNQDDSSKTEEFQLFTSRQSTVNAFMNNRGIMNVYLGLLAYAENEAQLAFILGHEYIHHAKEHSNNSFENFKKGRIKQVSKRASIKDFYKGQGSYSRAQELEADEESLKRFYMPLGYDKDDLLNFFDILLYSGYPWDTAVYDISNVFGRFGRIPDSLNIDTTFVEEFDDDYDDSKSTHPSIFKRKLAADQVMTDYEGESQFHLGEDRFYKVQKFARYAYLQSLLEEGRYYEVLYLTQSLDRQFGPSDVTRDAAVHAFAIISNNRIIAMHEALLPDTIYRKGPFCTLIEVIDQTNPEDLLMVSIGKAYDNYALDPENGYKKQLLISQIDESLNWYERTKDAFDNPVKEIVEEKRVLTKQEQKWEDYTNMQMSTEEQLLRYDILELIKEKILTEFSLNIFSSLSENEDFITLWTERERIYTEKASAENFISQRKKIENLVSGNIYDKLAARNQIEDERETRMKYGGVDRVLMLDPNVWSISQLKIDPVEYKKSLEFTETLKSEFSFVASKADADYEFLSFDDLEENSTTLYNELSILSRWLDEIYNRRYSDVPPSLQDEAIKIAKKHNTRYLGINRMLLVSNDEKSQYYIYTAMSVIGLPWTFKPLLKPYSGMYSFQAYDLYTGDIVFLDYEDYPQDLKKDFIRPTLYYSLMNLKTPKQ